MHALQSADIPLSQSTMSGLMALPTLCVFALLILSVGCEKGFRVVEEFDGAHISKHYQISFMGVDIFSLRSKPVISLLKEREETGDEEKGITGDIFNLDWEKWWTERGEPVLEVLKQNPHFVAAVCFVMAVIKGMRRSVVREEIDVKALADEIVAALPSHTVDTALSLEQIVCQLDQVTQNQDVIARAFARVISILRDGPEPPAAGCH